jgi:hypothetical protein
MGRGPGTARCVGRAENRYRIRHVTQGAVTDKLRLAGPGSPPIARAEPSTVIAALARSLGLGRSSTRVMLAVRSGGSRRVMAWMIPWEKEVHQESGLSIDVRQSAGPVSLLSNQ